MSIIRIRNLVTGAPVLFVTARHNRHRSNVELLPGFELDHEARFEAK